jgi:hypothetical protein
MRVRDFLSGIIILVSVLHIFEGGEGMVGPKRWSGEVSNVSVLVAPSG